MQQMFSYGIAGGLLSWGMYQDIRERKIPLWLLLLGAGVGAAVDIVWHRPPELWIAGLLPGLWILLLGKLSEEQIGYGDGWMLLVLGFYLSGKEVVALLLMGLFFCAFYTVGLFLLGKWHRRLRLPFLPFLWSGFLILALSRVLK